MTEASLDENPHVLSFRVTALEKGMTALSQDMLGLKSATVQAAEQSSFARAEVRAMRADLAKDHKANRSRLNLIAVLVPCTPFVVHWFLYVYMGLPH